MIAEQQQVRLLWFNAWQNNEKKYSKVLSASCGEGDLIDIMKQMPNHLNFASLPKMIGSERKVVISLAGYEKDEVEENFKLFTDFLDKNKIEYVLKDISL